MNEIEGDSGAARRRTWMVGGILLIVAALASLSAPLGPPLFVGWAGLVLCAVAFSVFAIGLGQPGSVTARRPVGTTALIALGAWVVAGPLVRLLYPAPPMDADPAAVEQYATTLQVVLTAIDAVGLVLAVIAVVQIVRARVVPLPWRWLPPTALGAVVIARVLQLLAIQPLGLPLPLDAAFFLQRLDVMATPVMLLLLGIVAVALAAFALRRAPVAVQS